MDDPETGAFEGTEREIDEEPLPFPAWAEAARPPWEDGESPDAFGPVAPVGGELLGASLPLAACEDEEVVDPDEAVVLDV